MLTQTVPRKSLLLAFILCGALGPFGLFYLGRRHGIYALLFCVPTLLLALRLFPNATLWIHLFFVATGGLVLAENRNGLVDKGDQEGFAAFDGHANASDSALGLYSLMAAFAVIFSVASVS